MASRAHRGHSGRVRVDDSAPRFRIGGVANVVAWLLLGVGVGVSLWSILTLGRDGTGAVLVASPLMALCIAAIRTEVRASPSGLQICSGWRRREIPWPDVEGFRVESARGTRRVLALIKPDAVIALPLGNGGPVITGRRELTSMRDALDTYRLGRT